MWRLAIKFAGHREFSAAIYPPSVFDATRTGGIFRSEFNMVFAWFLPCFFLKAVLNPAVALCCYCPDRVDAMLSKLKAIPGLKRSALIILTTATITWMLIALWIAIPGMLHQPTSPRDHSWYVENLVRSTLFVSTAYAGSVMVMGFVCLFLWKALRRY